MKNSSVRFTTGMFHDSGTNTELNPGQFRHLLENNHALTGIKNLDTLVNTPIPATSSSDEYIHPLHFCVMKNLPETFEALLLAGATPNSLNSMGETPLALAKRLANSATHFFADPFQEALNQALTIVSEKQTPIDGLNGIDDSKIKQLLDAGATPCEYTINTIIQVGQDPAVTAYLVDYHDVDLTKPGKDGKTPLSKLICGRNHALRTSLQKKTLMLIRQAMKAIRQRQTPDLPRNERGAFLKELKDIFRRDIDLNTSIQGRQLLHLAAYFGDVEVIRLLHKYNVRDFGVKTPRADTPPVDATPHQQSEAMEPMAVDDSALHIAVRQKHAGTVAALLGHLKSKSEYPENQTHLLQGNCPQQVNLDVKNNANETATSLSLSCGDEQIIAMLDAYRCSQGIKACIKSATQQSLDSFVETLSTWLNRLDRAMENLDEYRIDLRDNESIGPVRLAVDSGLTAEHIKNLGHLDKFNFSAVDTHGYNALHHVARHLLPKKDNTNRGVNLDEKDIYEMTRAIIGSMNESALHARTPNIFRAINEPLDIDSSSTAAHIAVNHNNKPVLKAIAETLAIHDNGCKVEDACGLTPLQHIVMYGKKDATEIWLDQRTPNPNHPPAPQDPIGSPEEGIILMQLAAKAGKSLSQILKEHASPEEDFAAIVAILIQYGAKAYYPKKDYTQREFSCSNYSLDTPALFIAASHENDLVARALLKSGSKGHKTYGLLWRKKPISMLLAHIVKLLFTLILLPLCFFGMHTPFKKSSYCKLAYGTCRLNALFDGPVWQRSPKPSQAEKNVPPKIPPRDYEPGSHFATYRQNSKETTGLDMNDIDLATQSKSAPPRPSSSAH